jgi:hypothetical protein
MPSDKTLRRHAALVDRMASAVGLDLEEAVLRGSLPADELPELVLRCTGCANPGGCETFLTTPAAQKGAVPVADIPYYCRNAGVFDDLAPR